MKNKKYSSNEFSRVCIINNMYGLLQYLLLSSLKEINDTFFFFSDDVSDSITKNFSHWVKIYTPTTSLGKLWFVIKIRYFIRRKYKFLKSAEIFGQDNLLLTAPLLADRQMNVVEDGMANYTLLPPLKKFGWLLSMLISPLMGQQSLGYSDSCKKLFLTGMASIPLAVKDKVELINLNDLWNKSSEQKQNTIVKLFNLSSTIVSEFKQCKSILITQPLSEDNVISEDEKMLLYKQLVGDKKIAIKPHPREKTNYAQFFPNAIILESHVPIQLLSLVGIWFKEVFTIFSTAALQFPNNPIVHFAGTNIHPRLVKKFGNIEYSNGEVIIKK